MLWIGVIVLVLLSTIVGLVIFNLAKGGVAWPIIHEIPEGYKGWIVVQYQDPRCAPRAVRGIFRIVRISTDGKGCTSDHAPKGWGYFTAEYTKADGTRVAPPFRLIATDPLKNLEIGFVGTEEEMQRNWDKYPR